MSQLEKDTALAIELQQQLDTQEIPYAVEPRLDCPHLPITTKEQSVFLDQPCQQCNDETENWQCLTCNIVLCSRYRQAHMQAHVGSSRHPVCLSYSDLSFWCFDCDSYVTHPVLDDIKHTAYIAKFHQEPPKFTTRIVQEQGQSSSSS
ncbi:uncharacterized protein BX664DRAFT_355050 [Halteromyces radiatus]|uniref:uncharacterized protein n=1 Tax=Halteromyces radiatus TaxID=101107 RepID=UPI0022207D86|nr:uncharacterized protein BX664DRAFT_355050 [Halteromyces radiatus]KAI8099649.1 hypothetical protein BX664DRAFT_355050 [Halteromyces radiatus]